MARLTKGQSAQLSEILFIAQVAQSAMDAGELEVARKNVRAIMKRLPDFVNMHEWRPKQRKRSRMLSAG